MNSEARAHDACLLVAPAAPAAMPPTAKPKRDRVITAVGFMAVYLFVRFGNMCVAALLPP